jgi:enolase-phosphatase E1
LTVEYPPGSIGGIILDIEGTTTSLAFVHDVLFPFARHHLREHLRNRWTSEETRHAIVQLADEWHRDVANGETPPPWAGEGDSLLSSVADYAEWLMDRDRKSQGLKLLQGHIWEGGYRNGELRSEVFGDVAPALERWQRCETTVAIYSSGSVLAQKLLFEHTVQGDLTPFITGFFDLAVGSKTSSDSYRKIASALGRPPAQLLFVSDVVRELEGARDAGCHTLLCTRPGNPAPPTESRFTAIKTFDDIQLGDRG